MAFFIPSVVVVDVDTERDYVNTLRGLVDVVEVDFVESAAFGRGSAKMGLLRFLSNTPGITTIAVKVIGDVAVR